MDIGNSNPSIAGLNFGPSALDYNIQSSGSGVLQLANGDSDATIMVLAGTQTITAPIQLANNTLIDPAASTTLSIAGSVAGTGSESLTIGDATYIGAVVETSTGTVSLTDATDVVAGTLQVDGAWTTSALNISATGGGQGSAQLSGSGTITLTSGGGLYYNSTAASTFAGNLAGGAGNAPLEVAGGSLTLTGSNSYTGGTAISAGANRDQFIRDRRRHEPDRRRRRDLHLRSVRYRSSFGGARLRPPPPRRPYRATRHRPQTSALKR